MLQSLLASLAIAWTTFYGTWIYEGSEEVDGFETLIMEIAEDHNAPLPNGFLDYAGNREIALRGDIIFNVDGYEMGPFPFASLIQENTTALETYYFYTHPGQPGYDYEEFELLFQDEKNLVLIDPTECESGPCKIKYPFKRLPNQEN